MISSGNRFTKNPRFTTAVRPTPVRIEPDALEEYARLAAAADISTAEFIRQACEGASSSRAFVAVAPERRGGNRYTEQRWPRGSSATSLQFEEADKARYQAAARAADVSFAEWVRQACAWHAASVRAALGKAVRGKKAKRARATGA